MSFPSTITAFPIPNPTSRLNNPSHSALENLQSSTIGQIETVIGLSGDSSTLGTLIGDVRSPGSNGGGHVQTANKGGTGQTSYNKGDLLFGQSQSVLTKFAIGQDNTYLVADSTQPVGVKWTPITIPKVAVSGSVVAYTGSTLASGETSIMSITIPASTLGTNGVIRARIFLKGIHPPGSGASDAIRFRTNFGSASIAVIGVGSIFNNVSGLGSISGVIETTIIASNTLLSQVGETNTNLVQYFVGSERFPSSVAGAQAFLFSNLSQDAGAAQIIGLTAQNIGANPNNITSDQAFTVQGFIIEKLI